MMKKKSNAVEDIPIEKLEMESESLKEIHNKSKTANF